MTPVVLQPKPPIEKGFNIPTTPQQFVNQYGDVIISVITTTVVFIIVYIVIYYVTKRLFKRGVRRAMEVRDVNETVISLSVSVAEALSLIIALVTAATITKFNMVLAAFATLTSAIVLAAGFAAQDLFSNFVAGVFILRDEPFHVGDWIEWDDGRGVVRSIKLRVTRVETFDNEMITVPNSKLANNAVKNAVWNDTLRINFLFGIGYGDDIALAREIILEEAEQVEGIIDNPSPSVRLMELGDSAVGLAGRVWIGNPTRGSYVRTRSEFVQAVKERFDEEGIDIPYPHSELTGDIGVSELTDDSLTGQQEPVSG